MEAFSDLPDALVRDLLTKSESIAGDVSEKLNHLAKNKENFRTVAASQNLIRRKADLDVPREPSVVGIDGSYQVHRLTAIDLCAAAAVAVEGTAKEERRIWQEPYHEIWVDSLPHQVDTTGALRGMMISMELTLAEKAPHDLVLLDGSFSSLIIYLNQGLNSLPEVSPKLAKAFLDRWNSGIAASLEALLKSPRTVALPKFTARNELASIINCGDFDGKTLATTILQPGEYTAPMEITSSGGQRGVDHLPRKYCPEPAMRAIQEGVSGLRVIYFRPFGWLPALRLEVTSSVASSPTRLAMVLEGISRQLFTPAVFEPYPLFLADRMVKSLGSGVSVIEQSVGQHVASFCTDTETAMLCLQNYRTEGGRGGV